MAVYRAQIATCQDSVFPVDRIIITPHFTGTLPTTAEALADEIITAWSAYMGSPGNTNELTVKIYDAADMTPPSYPLADKTVRAGAVSAAATNRDVALCLSFYSGVNRPRSRGRLYLPCSLIGISPSAARPTAGNQQRVADLVPVLTGIGGTSLAWCVWSRRDANAYPVTNWWVDNSWDSQRRRGTRPTARQSGTVASP